MPLVLNFSPYNETQISTIIRDRIESVNENYDIAEIFKPEAIKFCASKVASASGDVRKALDICR